MKTTTMAGSCLALVTLMLMASSGLSAQERPNKTHEGEVQIPRFQVDPSWPKIANGWVFGQVTWVASDAPGNIWVLQRPRSVRPGQKTGPPVMEFDQSGNYLGGWGGPGPGYDWPQIEHGIYIDYKGNVWICGSGKDDQVLKFTKDGKFVMQIGKPGLPQTNENTATFNRPTEMYVYPKTNEVFISDGYGNRRVIVFDADTGEYKRMWGAFGKAPQGPPPGVEGALGGGGARNPNRIPPRDLTPDDPGPSQFDTVHGINISHDDMVYVADRGGKRVQVFTTEGKYLQQVWIDRWCEAAGQACGNGQTTASVAFSADPQQRFLYVASRSPGRIWVFDRKTLQPLYAFGRPGIEPGEFFALHGMETDTKGNLYTTEVEDGKRVQKFVFKGLVWVSKKYAFDPGQ